MQTVEVETISPHQYRQRDRVVGERYQIEPIHLPLLITLKWVKPVKVEVVPTGAMKIKDKHRYVRSKIA